MAKLPVTEKHKMAWYVVLAGSIAGMVLAATAAGSLISVFYFARNEPWLGSAILASIVFFIAHYHAYDRIWQASPTAGVVFSVVAACVLGALAGGIFDSPKNDPLEYLGDQFRFQIGAEPKGIVGILAQVVGFVLILVRPVLFFAPMLVSVSKINELSRKDPKR